MLERAAAYVEPASQVFLQRVDTPLRSSRVLTLGFFRHGYNAPEPPLWWPHYLKTVRQIPQTSSEGCCEMRSCQDARVGSKRSQNRVGYATLKTQSLKTTSKTRSYSATSTIRQQGADAAHADATERADDFRFWSLDIDAQDQVLDINSQLSLTDEQNVSQQQQQQQQQQTRPSETNARLPETSDAKEVQSSAAHVRLEEILDLAIVRAGDATPLKQYEEAWELFIALPNQEPYASRVAAYLASSDKAQDQRRSISAFKITPLEDRTTDDYNNVVDVAGRRNNPSLMLSICKEANERQLDKACRQTALLLLLRRGLWKSAARLWEQCWAKSGRMHPHAGDSSSGYIHESGLDLIDSCLDLPMVLTRLCEQLRMTGAVGLNPTQHPILLGAAYELSWRLVASGRLMSVITLEGILRVFDELSTLELLKHEHLVTAVQTLSSAKRTTRTRHDLAVALYRNSHLRFPDQQMSPHILHGLIYLCYKAGESLEAFEYLLEELRARPNEKLQILPARSDYVGALRAMAFQGNVGAVNKLYKQFLADHEYHRDVREVVPALYVHAVLGDVSATQEAFDSLQPKFGFTADTVCWNILMFAHSRSPEPQNAFKVLDDMLQANVQPDAYTFSTLISICARVGDVTSVLSVLDKATRRGLKDIRFMLASLVRVYCLNGEIEHAEAIVANLSEFEIEGSPVPIWNELLKHHAYRSDTVAVCAVQQQMKAAGVEPDEYTYGTIMATLIRTGQTTQALQILRSLHLGGRIAATPFLYGLILHGFQREENRDMVTLIYRELEARFPTTSPSAQLSKLRSDIQRGLDRTRQHFLASKTPGETHRVELKEALRFLESLDQRNSNDFASHTLTSPQPGFVRESSLDAVPSIYSATVAETLALYGKPIQARGVLDWVDENRASGLAQRPESVRILTTRLLVAREQLLWSRVDELWREILQQGLKVSISPLLLRHSSVTFAVQEKNKPEDVMTELQNRLQTSRLTILPAQRFALSVPLTRYMISLDRQNRHDELVRVVDLFQALGFRLTGSNWNVYVQCLCGSPSREDRLAAFSIFAKKLSPFMSTYKLIDKGRWIDPLTFVGTPRPVRKNLPSISLRLLTRVRPEATPPSYITIVYLARILLDFEHLAQEGDDTLMKTVQKKYPKAFKRILDLPRLPDKVQRVLLLNKRPHALPKPSRSPRIALEGVAGSRSVLDRLSLENLDHGTAGQKRRKNNASQTEDSMLEDIALAEEALGEIPREPLFHEKEGRWETPVEQSDRVSKTMLDYLTRIDELEKVLQNDTFIIGDQTGDPVHSPTWDMENLTAEVTGSDKRLLKLALDRIPGRQQSQSKTTRNGSRLQHHSLSAPELRAKRRPRPGKTQTRTKATASGLSTRVSAPRSFQKVASLNPAISRPFSTSCIVRRINQVAGRDQAARVGHIRFTPGNDADHDSSRTELGSQGLESKSTPHTEHATTTLSIPIRKINGSFLGLRPELNPRLRQQRMKELARLIYTKWVEGKAASKLREDSFNKIYQAAVDPTTSAGGTESQRAIVSPKIASSVAKVPARRNKENNKRSSVAESSKDTRVKSLDQPDVPLAYNNTHAAAEGQAQTPGPDVRHRLTLHRRLLPPKRDPDRIDKNFNIPKERRREHRRQMLAENSSARFLRSKERDRIMSPELELLPLYRQDEQRRLKAVEDVSLRTQRINPATQAQRRRLERSLSSGHSIDWAAELSWQQQPATAQRRLDPNKTHRVVAEKRSSGANQPRPRTETHSVNIPREQFAGGDKRP